MNARSDPPELRDCSPAAKRVYDALHEADKALSKSQLSQETRHAEHTIKKALSELRSEDLIVGWGWPKKYQLTDDANGY